MSIALVRIGSPVIDSTASFSARLVAELTIYIQLSYQKLSVIEDLVELF